MAVARYQNHQWLTIGVSILHLYPRPDADLYWPGIKLLLNAELGVMLVHLLHHIYCYPALDSDTDDVVDCILIRCH